MREMIGSTTGSREDKKKKLKIFAAYLLIPEDKLNEKLKEEWVKESPDPIPELAEEFQVSENFMRKRL
jgi:Zn-dependent peptidase ImmA (M78 family)